MICQVIGYHMINTGIRAHKNQLAREFIRSQLVLLKPGEALLPLRKLIQLSGLGRIMLESAITEAIASGMLEARSRSGYYRTDNMPINNEPFGIVITNRFGQLDAVGSFHIPSFTHKIVIALYEIGVAHGASMKVLRLDEKASIFDYIKKIEQEKLKRLFAVSPGSTDFLRCLLLPGVNLVSVSGTTIPEVFSVQPAGNEVIKKAMDYLFAHNHQLIAHIYCHASGCQYSGLPLLNEYYRRMAEKGYRVWSHFLAPYPDEKRLINSLEMMFKRKPTPTAIICPSVWLPTLYAFLSSRSLLIGRDISVVSTGQESEMLPRPALLTNIPEELAAKAWQMMNEQLQGASTPYSVRIGSRLIPGKSVVRLR